MNALMRYVRASYAELKNHVTWPTWTELQQTSVVVIVASIFIGCVVALMDTAWAIVFRLLYQ